MKPETIFDSLEVVRCGVIVLEEENEKLRQRNIELTRMASLQQRRIETLQVSLEAALQREHELVQRFAEQAPKRCPVCGGRGYVVYPADRGPNCSHPCPACQPEGTTP